MEISERIYTHEEVEKMRAGERERYYHEIEKIHTQYADIFSKYSAAIQLLNKLLESEVRTYANQ